MGTPVEAFWTSSRRVGGSLWVEVGQALGGHDSAQPHAAPAWLAVPYRQSRESWFPGPPCPCNEPFSAPATTGALQSVSGTGWDGLGPVWLCLGRQCALTKLRHRVKCGGAGLPAARSQPPATYTAAIRKFDWLSSALPASRAGGRRGTARTNEFWALPVAARPNQVGCLHRDAY